MHLGTPDDVMGIALTSVSGITNKSNFSPFWNGSFLSQISVSRVHLLSNIGVRCAIFPLSRGVQQQQQQPSSAVSTCAHFVCCSFFLSFIHSFFFLTHRGIHKAIVLQKHVRAGARPRDATGAFAGLNDWCELPWPGSDGASSNTHTSAQGFRSLDRIASQVSTDLVARPERAEAQGRGRGRGRERGH